MRFSMSCASDRLWHNGLRFKLRNIFPDTFYHILHSFFQDWNFKGKHNHEYLSPYDIIAGVPQGSIIPSVLYNIYKSDLPLHRNTTLATYADDKAILGMSLNPVEAS